MAAFINVLNVVLIVRGKISSYFWGILGAILYGIYSFAYGYVGDAQLFVMFFLPMQFVGIYFWSKELDSQATTRVRSLTWIRWLLVLVVCVGLAAAFFYEISAFSKWLTSQYYFENMLVPRILDATTNALSVVAQFLLIFCYWEQYILWICVNLMAIFMYSGECRETSDEMNVCAFSLGLLQTKLDINLLLVWIMLFINSVVGLYTWFVRWRKARTGAKI